MNEKPLILQLDVAGNPCRWIDFEEAAYYYCKGLVAWTTSHDGYTLWGGHSRLSGERSFLDVDTIIAVKGEMSHSHLMRTPVLTNRALFRRDQHLCAYCVMTFAYTDLTRDHVTPRSRGGKNGWLNVVTACGSCNKAKDSRTPEEAHMKLAYVPYAPSRSEFLLLMNRNVLADQMEFLKAKIPAHSRVHISDLHAHLTQRPQKPQKAYRSINA